MFEDGGPPAKKMKIGRDELDKLSREELLQRYYEQETYIETLQASKADGDGPDGGGGQKETADRLKQQQVEATRRENVLVMRLTTKEQEMQDYLNQIQELKQAQNPTTAQLRGMLLDPAINLMFQRMKKEVESCKEKLEQAQNDLAAWKFTPDSQTGKRLMAKCRMLLQENEELGKVMSSGRTAKLEGEIALEKKFVEEMKISQAETDEFLLEMDEDLEGMQSTIYFLQQQLKDAKEEIAKLQDENRSLHQSQISLTTDSTAASAAAATAHSPTGTSVQPPQLNAQWRDPGLNEEQEMDLGVEPAADRDSITGAGQENKRTATPTMGRTVSPGMTGNVVDSVRVCSPASPLPYREITRTSSPQQQQQQHLDEEQQQQPQYSNSHGKDDFHDSQDNSKSSSSSRRGHDSADGSATAPNGNHNTMETDATPEGREPESCENDESLAAVAGKLDGQHQQPTQQSEALETSTGGARHHNNSHAGIERHRPSQSSEGVSYTLEATDASSDAWSPSNQSKTSGMVSDDDQKPGSLEGPNHEYRTEGKVQASKLGETLHNGLILSRQYEAAEDT